MTTWVAEMDKLAKSESFLVTQAGPQSSPYHQQEAESFTALGGLAKSGYVAMTGAADRGTAYAVGTITLAQLAGRVKAIQDDLTSIGLLTV